MLQVENYTSPLQPQWGDRTELKGRQGTEYVDDKSSQFLQQKVFPEENLFKTLPEILQSEDIFKLPGYKPRFSEYHNSPSERHFLELTGQVFCADRKMSSSGNEVEVVAQIDDRNVDGRPDFKYECTGDNTARLVYGDEQVIVEFEDQV